ncbi:MAG: adenylate/guanylate cyclase domain-containing protein [Acidimicrobiia bacterium]|nr:adenylate/guanylate cyclase domain-containing protein [Acidimicrobiia bacterium]
MQVPILRSYLRLRDRPRPERVSQRHMRRIGGYAGLQGVIWAVAIILAFAEFSQADALVVTAAVFVWAYSSAAAYSTMPVTSSVFIVPMVATTFIGLGVNGFVDWGPLLLLFLGAGGGLVFLIVKNWHATVAAVRLGEAVKLQSEKVANVSGQLAKYMSPKLFDKIFSGKQQVEIVSTRKKLTVFFSDVVSFTEITDQLESEELTALLNHYLSEMSQVAREHGATYDKFIGDALVFYFGDPDTLGVKEDAEACVRMAIAMQRRVRELQSEWRDRGVERPFEIRIGINTGYCTVGNFGSEDRMAYTIIGSEVNLAARLESAADVGGILLSNETYSLVKDWLMAGEAAAITVKGFPRPVTTYRVKGIYEELKTEGHIIHHDRNGLRLTIESGELSDTHRAEAISILEDAATELKR